MAVNQGNRLREKDRLHGQGVGGGDAHRDKPLPGAAGGRNAGADGLEDAGGQVEHGLYRGGTDERLKERHRVRDDRNRASFLARWQSPGLMHCGQKIGCSQVLGGKDAIDRIQRELAPAVQKIGEMGLPKAGLAGQ